jgi:hypothetical protein
VYHALVIEKINGALVYQAMGIEKNKRSFSVPSYGS